MTRLAGEGEVCHKLHLDGHHASTLTLLASASVGIEGEVGWGDVHLTSQLLTGKELANGVVSLDVCSRIGAGALAYGVLVDHLHMSDVAQTALAEVALDVWMDYALDE